MGTPWNLPSEAADLLQQIGAPQRLCAHLGVVHGTARTLMLRLAERWPPLPCDWDAVLFGAAIHDIGKTLHPEELDRPGNRHEAAGEWLLLCQRVPSERARFARTHGCWDEAGTTIEDWLLALADKLWKGTRVFELESKIAGWVAVERHADPWEVFQEFDEILEELTDGAEARLAGRPRTVCPSVLPWECC